MSDAPIYLAGHSLGGANAYLYAASRIARGLRLDGLFCFAPARPGDGKIGALIRSRGDVVIRALGNLKDPVPDVPFDMPLLGDTYEQPRWPLEAIDEAPDPGADIVFGRHRIALYVRGAAKLKQGSGPISLNRAAAEVARLYDDSSGWDWINPIDGLFWAMIQIDGARLLIRRGSHTAADWFKEDFDAVEEPWYGGKASRGFVAGVAPVKAALDKALAGT